MKNAPAGILAVGITTLLVAISSTATFAITPFFMKDTLGVGLVAIGMIDSATEFLSQVSRLVSGIVSDKINRCKPMFWLGTFFSFIAKPLIIMAQGANLVLASKVFDRLGNGLSATPRDSYIALHSTPGTKGAFIGLTMTFKTIGCVLGPFIVMLFMGILKLSNFRLLLCFTAIPALLGVIICHIYMKESHAAVTVSHKNSFKVSYLFELPKKFWLFLCIMFLFMLARAPESYLILNLRDAGLPEWFCAGAIGFFNLVSVFISYPAGSLSDKYGRPQILLVSFVSLLLAVLTFILCTPFFCVLGIIFWGIQRASSQIISVSCIADIVDKKVIGSAIGLLNIVTGVASIISSYITGELGKIYGIAQAYYFPLFSITIAAIFLAVFMVHEIKQKLL